MSISKNSNVTAQHSRVAPDMNFKKTSVFQYIPSCHILYSILKPWDSWDNRPFIDTYLNHSQHNSKPLQNCFPSLTIWKTNSHLRTLYRSTSRRWSFRVERGQVVIDQFSPMFLCPKMVVSSRIVNTRCIPPNEFFTKMDLWSIELHLKL